MEQFVKDIILKTFLKCFGLQNALKKSIENNDMTLQVASIDSLATRSGLRKDFINKNLLEIVNLK